MWRPAGVPVHVIGEGNTLGGVATVGVHHLPHHPLLHHLVLMMPRSLLLLLLVLVVGVRMGLAHLRGSGRGHMRVAAHLGVPHVMVVLRGVVGVVLGVRVVMVHALLGHVVRRRRGQLVHCRRAMQHLQ